MPVKITDTPTDIHGKPYARNVMFALLLIATFGGMLTQTFLGTAYPTLMDKFHIDLATAQGASTWFLLANGIMIPVSAYFITKFSTRWLYVVSYALLFVGTLVCYAAPTGNTIIGQGWNVFLAGRIIQAAAVGISMPLFQVVIVNIFPPERMGIPMGMGGLVIGLGPAIGPTYAGWLLSANHTVLGVHLNDWRTIFLLPLIMIGIALVLSPFLIKDVVPNRPMKLDPVSLVLSLIGFGLFLFGFTEVATYGWGNFTNVILPIVAGALIILVFILKQLRMKDPFLDLSVFKNKQFTWTTIGASVNTIAMMGVELMLPTYIQNVHGLSAFQSGLLLLPGAIMMAVMSPIAGAVYNKKGARPLAFLGFIILTIGTFPYMFLTATTAEHFITTTYWLRFVAIGIIMMPLITSAMNSLPREESAQGSASNNAARMIASSIGVGLLASVTQNVTTTSSPASSLKDANPLQYADKMINAALNGFHVSFAVAFAFAVLGILCAFFLHKGIMVLGKSGGQAAEDHKGANKKGADAGFPEQAKVAGTEDLTRRTGSVEGGRI